ncbi:MAG: hypothetical protein WED82_05915, partial [Balneolales bacterium]
MGNYLAEPVLLPYKIDSSLLFSFFTQIKSLLQLMIIAKKLNLMSKNKQSRRNFISNIVFGTAGAVGAGSLFSSRASADSFRRLSDNPIFSLSERAPDGKVLKAGLVG